VIIRGDAVPNVLWYEPEKAIADEMHAYGEIGERLKLLIEEYEAIPAFIEAGLDSPTRIMFVGPSGCGKTMAARWLGWRLGMLLGVIDLSHTLARYIGSTGENITAAINAVVARKGILFLDEIDAVAVVRANADDQSGADSEFAQRTSILIQLLDGLPPSQLLLAATNNIKAVDPAIRRRLREEIYFDPPDAAARLFMAKKWLRRVKGIPAEELAMVVRDTEGLGGADVRVQSMALGRQIILAQRKAARMAEAAETRQ
jgi:SpoVK/Ycf46/Vps4 family AAA+-type ATPase